MCLYFIQPCKQNTSLSFKTLKSSLDYLTKTRFLHLQTKRIKLIAQGEKHQFRKFESARRTKMNFLKQAFNVTKMLTSEAITSLSRCNMATLNQMHRTGPHFKTRPPRQPLDGKPFAKGVILKVLIKKPRKPNSANRKCVLLRLSTGKEMVAYVPGIGHNLQEHNVVLARCGRLQDVPGVKLKCVRGVYDLPHVIKAK